MRQTALLVACLVFVGATPSGAATQLVQIECVQPERHANPERLWIRQSGERPDWYRVTYQARALGLQFAAVILADSKNCVTHELLPQLVDCADQLPFDPPPEPITFKLNSRLVAVTQASSPSAFEKVEYLEFHLRSPLIVPNRGEQGLPPSDQPGSAVIRFPTSACRVEIAPR